MPEAIVPGVTGANLTEGRRRPGLGAWLLFSPLLAWLLCFVVIPTLMLVVYSFCTRDALGRVVFEFTTANYVKAFDPLYLKIFGLSVWYAFLTAIICLILGYPVAYTIGRAPPSRRNLLLTLIMIPFWTSFLVRTYAWITILSENGILNSLLMAAKIIPEPIPMMYTPFAIVVGLVYTYLPFMILPIYGSVEKLDNSLIEAAYDLGAGPLRAFSSITVPLTRPGIVAGFLLVFVPSIAMFAITDLMGGSKTKLIGNVIQNQFTSARDMPFGAALGTLLLLIFLAALVLSRLRKPA